MTFRSTRRQNRASDYLLLLHFSETNILLTKLTLEARSKLFHLETRTEMQTISHGGANISLNTARSASSCPSVRAASGKQDMQLDPRWFLATSIMMKCNLQAERKQPCSAHWLGFSHISKPLFFKPLSCAVNHLECRQFSPGQPYTISRVVWSDSLSCPSNL
jgi:hypothetical protein